MSLTYSEPTDEDTVTQLELLRQALELGNLTVEQRRDVRRQIR